MTGQHPPPAEAITAATHVIWRHRYREHISSDAIAAEALEAAAPWIAAQEREHILDELGSRQVNVPDDAITAALAAVRARHDDDEEFRKDVEDDRDVMRLDTIAALEAAAPWIAAQEREACAQLAEDRMAVYPDDNRQFEGCALPFADVLRARQP